MMCGEGDVSKLREKVDELDDAVDWWVCEKGIGTWTAADYLPNISGVSTS
jgi:hypothetical protein